MIPELYASNLILMDLCKNGSNNADSRAKHLADSPEGFIWPCGWKDERS
jgi:hypothetical protein